MRNFLQQQEEARIQERRQHQEQIKILTDLVTANSSRSQPAENNTSTEERPQQNVSNHPRPTLLDTDITYSKYKAWREAWDDYSMLQRIDTLPLHNQHAFFRSCLTEDMRTYLKCAIDINTGGTSTVKEILDAIQAHLRSKRNVTLDRVAFVERKQEEGKQFDSFFVAIKKLADEADICQQCVEVRLCTRIMSGVRDTELRHKLLALNPFPELKTVLDICRAHESAIKNARDLSSKKITKVANNHPKNKYWDKSNKKNFTETCYFCGKKERHPRKSCPAVDARCGHCGKIRHFKALCRQKNKPTIKEAKNSTEEEDNNVLRTGIVKHPNS